MNHTNGVREFRKTLIVLYFSVDDGIHGKSSSFLLSLLPLNPISRYLHLLLLPDVGMPLWKMIGMEFKTGEVCTHNAGCIAAITNGHMEGATFLFVGLVYRTPPSYSRLNLYITISPDMRRPSTNAFQELPVTVDSPTLFP